MMTYAQIKNGIVKNIIILADSANGSDFNGGYDSTIRIDNISPQPGINWTYDGNTFSAPVVIVPTIPVSDQIAAIISNAKTFGNTLMIQFATENVLLGLTQDQMDSLLDALTDVMAALSTGSLKIAILRLNRLDPNSNVNLTVDRIQKYRNLIEDYLGIPRT